MELGFGGGTGGSLGSEGLLTNVCEMAGFVAVAADFSGRWAQVTKVLLFAIPEKKKQDLFPGLSKGGGGGGGGGVGAGGLGGFCWRALMQYNGTVLQ